MKYYKVFDCQYNRYFHDYYIFKGINEVINDLADYHDIDYTGVKDDGKDTPYKDIYEFLATLKDDKARVGWLCEYGEWELEEVTEEEYLAFKKEEAKYK